MPEAEARWQPLAPWMIGTFVHAESAAGQVHGRRKSERLLQALYGIVDLSGSQLDMDEMLERIHAVVASLMSADNLYIVLYDPAREVARFLSILALAGTIGIETIGEGVETARQRDVLRRLGCLYGQGFLYGSPRPFDAIGS